MESKQDMDGKDSRRDQTAEKGKESLLLLLKDIPDWMQDNDYIVTGYRQPSNSYQKSAASLTYLHNESVNIWTHLVGAILIAMTGAAMHFIIRPRFQMASSGDVMVFACFFLGAVLCLGMSATFHTIMNHSASVAKFGNRLDHIGIIILIWGSFIPSIYYGFSSEPTLIHRYWTMITTIGAGTLIVVFHPKCRSPEWRPLRAFMFVAMGLSAIVPVLHGLQLYGWKQLEYQIGLRWLITQGALYVLGAAIYAARVPERWKPGSFDIWMNSHQIFHVLVLMAVAAHLMGILKAFDYEHSFRSGIMASYSKARIFGRP